MKTFEQHQSEHFENWTDKEGPGACNTNNGWCWHAGMKLRKFCKVIGFGSPMVGLGVCAAAVGLIAILAIWLL